MRNCADELGMDKKMFPKPDVLLSVFGVVSGRQGDLRSAVEERFEHAEVEIEDILKVQTLYVEKKRATNTMDFDDLLIYPINYCMTMKICGGFIRMHLGMCWWTSIRIQMFYRRQLCAKLVSGHGNLMVVGDDFQSIYSWRGADFRNF